jgi:hypothetical protein
MNKLHVGFDVDIPVPRKGGCLFLADEVPELPSWRRAKIFDPSEHSFDVLEDMDYLKATAFVDALLALMPGGENTLTKEEAEYILLEALLSSPSSLETLIEESKDPMREKARRMICRLLLSPVLRRVLCEKTNFPFKKSTVILARLNRVELGDFDALAIGLFLMAHFKGQVIVPDLGFYGRDGHVNLIRQGRLIAGVSSLKKLPEDLRDAALSIPDKVASGALYDDAVTLAKYEGLRPDPTREDNPYNRFIDGAMGG